MNNQQNMTVDELYQNLSKIILNSCYTVPLSPTSRYYSPEINESIKNTGSEILKLSIAYFDFQKVDDEQTT